MTEKTVKVRIARFDPAVDEATRFQDYEVPLKPRMTVMDVLDYIYENLDPTISYYKHTACYRSACGRCNATINGKPSLSCNTEVTGDLTVGPLSHFNVIRDLVVEGL
jgi:fumarate reductase iron-sulfur subunit